MTNDHTLAQRAAAEFIGTFSIVFFGAGAVVIELLTAPASAGTTFALNGLGFGALGWVGIGVAFWGAVTIPIYALGHVSGQHINPAVTVPLWLTDRIETRPAIVYVVAQLAGGIAGSLVFALVRGIEAVTEGAMGATVPFPSVTVWQAVVNEAVITFFLMLTVMAFSIDDRTPDSFAGLAIGFVVAIGVVTTGNISGASFNPARTLGPYVANTLLGGPNLWHFAWIYIVGPIGGATGATYLYDWMVLETGSDASEQPMESRSEGDPSGS